MTNVALLHLKNLTLLQVRHSVLLRLTNLTLRVKHSPAVNCVACDLCSAACGKLSSASSDQSAISARPETPLLPCVVTLAET